MKTHHNCRALCLGTLAAVALALPAAVFAMPGSASAQAPPPPSPQPEQPRLGPAPPLVIPENHRFLRTHEAREATRIVLEPLAPTINGLENWFARPCQRLSNQAFVCRLHYVGLAPPADVVQYEHCADFLLSIRKLPGKLPPPEPDEPPDKDRTNWRVVPQELPPGFAQDCNAPLPLPPVPLAQSGR